MEPFLGEIKMFGGTYAPQGWAKCDGALLQISEYQALYALIGTAYGGDGQTTFAVPDLRGRIPIHRNAARPLGQRGGVEFVTLTAAQMPTHNHQAMAQTADGTESNPEGAVWAKSSLTMYANAAANGDMRAEATTVSGGNQAHDNLMPFLCVNFIIALEGLWPAAQ